MYVHAELPFWSFVPAGWRLCVSLVNEHACDGRGRFLARDEQHRDRGIPGGPKQPKYAFPVLTTAHRTQNSSENDTGSKQPSVLPRPILTQSTLEMPLCHLEFESGRLEETALRDALLLDVVCACLSVCVCVRCPLSLQYLCTRFCSTWCVGGSVFILVLVYVSG